MSSRPKPRTSSRSILMAAVLCAALFVVPPAVEAAFEREWPDAASAGLCSDGDWSDAVFAAEPADSGGTTALWSLRFDAGELFGLEALRGTGVRAARSGERLSFAFRAARLGGGPLTETALLLSATLRTGPRAQVSIRTGLLELSGEGLRSKRACPVDVFASTQMFGSVLGRVTAANILGARLGGEPLRQRLGLEVELPTARARLVAGCGIESGFEPSLHVGVEVRHGSFLALRAGARTAPDVFSAGVGIVASGAAPSVDLAWQWHPLLGASAFVSLSWSR